MKGEEASDVERAMAALSGDPLLAGQEGAPASLIVWNPSITRVLYASEAASPVRALVADPAGRVRLGRGAMDRLKVLAGGLADRDRFRLELLRLGRDRSSPLTMLACRRLELGGGPALLSVIVGGAPGGRIAPGLAAPSRPPASVHEPVPTDRPMGPDTMTETSERETVDGTEIAGSPAGTPRPVAPTPRRFLWSCDAQGRITSVSAGLAGAVGAEHADIVGRSWAELARGTLLDPMMTVERHLASGRAWQDIEVAWRAAEPGYVVPVTLGARPVRTPEGVVEGYRGSGLVRLPETARLGVERRVWRERVWPKRVWPERVSRERLSQGLAEPEVVTPLPGAAVPAEMGTAEAATTVAATTEAATPGNAATLSYSERGALHEIARALGGRFDHAEDEPDPDRRSAEVIPMPGPALPNARPREADPLGLLDQLPVGIVVFRGETPIYLNATLLAQLGYADLAEIVGHGAVQALSGAGDGPTTTVLAARSGASIGVEVEGTAIAWGELPARLVTVTRRPDRDPAARLEAAELELAAARGRHATLTATLDLAGVGASTLDDAGRILSLDGRARRLLGYEAREVAGEPFTTLLAHASHAAFAGWMERLRADTGAPDAECRLLARLRDGAEVPLLMRAARTGAGGVAVILVWREAPADTGAEGASEPLPPLPARVLAQVSHEILGPANAIVGLAGRMLGERPGPTGERDRTQLRGIARSGEQVAALATDLLDLSQMASGSGRLVPTSLDLNDLVAESVAKLQPSASRERVVMRTSLRSDLAPVVADERSIRQIAFSVLSNAIRDTGAGGQVIVSTARTELGDTALRVRDTGGRAPSGATAPNRPAGVTHTVREPFSELSLPLSQALAEANRATFRVASDGARGTLVEVVFPAARDAAE